LKKLIEHAQLEPKDEEAVRNFAQLGVTVVNNEVCLLTMA